MQSRSEFIHTYLLERGLNPTTASQELLAQAEVEYKRFYNREKKREYRSRDVTSHVRMTKAEAKLIQQNAKRHSQSVGPFLKACAMAYLQKTFVLPDDELLRDLIFQIRAIGNNINQLSHLANQTKIISPQHVTILREHLNKIEELVTDQLTDPPDVLGLVKEAINANPALVATIRNLLDSHRSQ